MHLYSQSHHLPNLHEKAHYRIKPDRESNGKSDRFKRFQKSANRTNVPIHLYLDNTSGPALPFAKRLCKTALWPVFGHERDDEYFEDGKSCQLNLKYRTCPSEFLSVLVWSQITDSEALKKALTVFVRSSRINAAATFLRRYQVQRSWSCTLSCALRREGVTDDMTLAEVS